MIKHGCANFVKKIFFACQLDRFSTHSKHIHNYINKLRKTSLSFSSFATFYLAYRNKAIQRKVRKVDDKTWLCQFAKKIFFACQLDRYSTHSNIFIIILINYAKLR